METRRLFRSSSWDALLVAAAFAEGALVLVGVGRARPGAGALPWAVLIAIGLWWNSNTVSHNHLHNPLFRARVANRLFSLYLSALTGVPQAIWRMRHFAHHHPPAGRSDRARRLPSETWLELAIVGGVWLALLLGARAFFLAALLPGTVGGLLLCQLQGHFEHAGAGAAGISHYGGVYNLLWFNDGYHVEHHRHPGEHWTRLPGRRVRGATSGWPPVLRWLGVVQLLQAWLLGWLEKGALASPRLQRFMLASHERAFRALLPSLGARRLERVCVVGGGLFPRTALVLRRVLPSSRIVLLDASLDNLTRARTYLAARGEPVAGFEWVHARYSADAGRGFDLVIVPLAFVGDRAGVYEGSAALAQPATLVHDWIWRRRGRAGAVVSWLLLKRLNLT